MLDADLEERHRFPLPLRHDSGDADDFAVGRGGCLLAVSRDDGIEVAGSGPLSGIQWRRQHGYWSDYPSGRGACAFSPDGSVLWVVVRPEEADGEGPDGPFDGDECHAYDAATGELLARASLGVDLSYARLHPHPGGRQVGLVVGQEHDWVSGYWVGATGRRLVMEPLGQSSHDDHQSLEAVAPDGNHCLTRSLSTLRSHAHPSNVLLAERLMADILPEGHPGLYTFVHRDASSVLATFDDGVTPPRSWLLDMPSLELADSVVYPEPLPMHTVASAGDGMWITVHDDVVSQWSTA
ncbi:hypothetical protein AMK27_36120 [Streptomyces sp. CB02009]|uniref:hypothetical protein n=1 Tax=Streptomyces sp. CB02009 TaxID=1703938 RepID=UPI00093FBEBD|nr:hypothetical protein [Streptomyces sp. CB02009]OKJ49498.1 hypothetical protein AMK27_36120 [Streptomyces sp. CB02009]